jgi:hypothetical protein
MTHPHGEGEAILADTKGLLQDDGGTAVDLAVVRRGENRSFGQIEEDWLPDAPVGGVHLLQPTASGLHDVTEAAPVRCQVAHLIAGGMKEREGHESLTIRVPADWFAVPKCDVEVSSANRRVATNPPVREKPKGSGNPFGNARVARTNHTVIATALDSLYPSDEEDALLHSA